MHKQKKLYIGTNTKMYKSISETVAFLKELNELIGDIPEDSLELFVIPSFTALESAGKLLKESRIQLGAQNMCWEERGQFTGEISPLMLQEVGVDIVEIGHSERRHVLGENDYQENLKVLSALRHGFTALLCIGETSEQKGYNLSDEVLSTQLKIGLHGVTKEEAKKLWIAYEPVWAIGVNGKPASKEYVERRHAAIKSVLCKLFGENTGRSIPVFYGGSVNRQNAQELIQVPGIDGLFIGRSAWEAQNFSSIIHEVYDRWKSSGVY